MNFKESLNKVVEASLSAVQPIAEIKSSINARQIEVINPEELGIYVDCIEMPDTQVVTELAAHIIDNDEPEKATRARIAMLQFDLGRASLEDTHKKLKDL